MSFLAGITNQSVVAADSTLQQASRHKLMAGLCAISGLSLSLVFPQFLGRDFNPLAKFVLFGAVPSAAIVAANIEAKKYHRVLPELQYAEEYASLLRTQQVGWTQAQIKEAQERMIEAQRPQPPQRAPLTEEQAEFARIQGAFAEFDAKIVVTSRSTDIETGKIRHYIKRGKDLKPNKLAVLMKAPTVVATLIEAGLCNPSIKLEPGKLFIESDDPNAELYTPRDLDTGRMGSAPDSTGTIPLHAPMSVPPSGVGTGEVAPATHSPEAEQQNQSQRLIHALSQFGVKATAIDFVIGARFARHRIQLEPGIKFETVQRLAGNLQIALRLPQAPIISHDADVYVDIPTQPKILYFDDYVKTDQSYNRKPGLFLAFGVSVTGGLMDFDLSDPDCVHWLIGGKTGGGKTEEFIALIQSGVHRYSPQRFQYCLSTIKPEDFCEPFFQSNPWQWEGLAPVKTAEGALDLLISLNGEMEARRKLLEQSGCKNIDIYNAKNPESTIPHLVYVLDEWTGTREQLAASDGVAKELGSKEESKVDQFDRLTILLGGGARSSGIHLMIGDQKPVDATLSTSVRSNLGGRLCLKVAESQDSKTVLGINNAGGETLLGKGDMIVYVAGRQHRLQGLLVRTEDLQTSYPVIREQPEDDLLEQTFQQMETPTPDPWAASGLSPEAIAAVKSIQGI